MRGWWSNFVLIISDSKSETLHLFCFGSTLMFWTLSQLIRCQSLDSTLLPSLWYNCKSMNLQSTNNYLVLGAKHTYYVVLTGQGGKKQRSNFLNLEFHNVRNFYSAFPPNKTLIYTVGAMGNLSACSALSQHYSIAI